MYQSPDKHEVAKGNVKYLLSLIQYLKPHKLLIIGVLVALLFSSTAMLSLGYGLKYLIDDGLGNQNAELLDQALLILLTVTVLLAASSFARFFLITKIGELVVASIRKDIFNHLVNLSPAFFELRKVGDVISRVTADTTVIQTVVGSSVSIALRNIIMLAGSITMLIITSPKLTGMIAVMVPLMVIPVLILGRKVRAYSRSSQARVAELSGQISESLMGIKTVQSYNRQGHEYTLFIDRVQDAFAAAMQRVRMRSWLTAIVILVAFSNIGVVLWIGGHDVIEGNITPGELSSFVFYSVLLAGAFGALSEVIGDVQRAAGAAEELIELLAVESDIVPPANPKTLPEEVKGEIVFDHVEFAYPSRPNENAINDISFKVAPGETVAIVGPSGTGKSTLFQLLLRFYDPQKGSISLDGIDITALDPNDLRKPIALVSQEPAIFSTTIRNNICYGKLNASEEELMEAAKAARCYDFIIKLKDGFDTYVGERGVRLSGGERQRIAIARAMIKKPRILLLDEATNALDADNEQLVQEALNQLKGSCTTLIIAHRLATVMEADRIIALNHGAIEAIGTHDQLIEQGNIYQKLAALQFGNV